MRRTSKFFWRGFVCVFVLITFEGLVAERVYPETKKRGERKRPNGDSNLQRLDPFGPRHLLDHYGSSPPHPPTPNLHRGVDFTCKRQHRSVYSERIPTLQAQPDPSQGHGHLVWKHKAEQAAITSALSVRKKACSNKTSITKAPISSDLWIIRTIALSSGPPWPETVGVQKCTPALMGIKG